MAVGDGDSLPARSTPRALAWAFLAMLGVALVLGALFFWLGVPALVLWTLSKLTSSSTTHFVLGMICVPTAMALFGVGLVWLNGLYVRATARLRANAGGEPPRSADGPLVPILLAAALISLVAFCVWFVFLAHSTLPEAPGSNSLVP